MPGTKKQKVTGRLYCQILLGCDGSRNSRYLTAIPTAPAASRSAAALFIEPRDTRPSAHASSGRSR